MIYEVKIAVFAIQNCLPKGPGLQCNWGHLRGLLWQSDLIKGKDNFKRKGDMSLAKRPKISVLGRVWRMTRETRGRPLLSTCFLNSSGDFLWRRHVSYPAPIIFIQYGDPVLQDTPWKVMHSTHIKDAKQCCVASYYYCSLSVWRVVRGSKLMHLDLIHGLFIT